MLAFSANYRFNLDRLEFKMSSPGVINASDRYILPEEENPALNYYMNMALWVGTKQGEIINVISGNGNTELAGFTEWKYIEKPQQVDSLSIKNYTTIIYKSEYNDKIPMPGHVPTNITVKQRTIRLKELTAVLFEYTIISQEAVDLMNAGIFFDFDIPEKDHTCNPKNDLVSLDPGKKIVYMANSEDTVNSPIPAVMVLSKEELRCVVFSLDEEPESDLEKWLLINQTNQYKHKVQYTNPDDYRFIVHSNSRTIAAGDSILFTVALLHKVGNKSVNSVVNKLQRWYDETPNFNKKKTPHEKFVNVELTREFRFSQNYPNPFNPSTRFEVELPQEANIQVAVYDVTGRLVQILYKGNISPGSHPFIWSGQDHSGHNVRSGIYFIKVKSRNFEESRKILLIR